MKIKANGITINYRIDGPDNAPCLVFSNSLATSLAMWDEQAAALKDKYRVLRYDQRGHGGSDVPSGRYAYDTLLADALGCSTPWASQRRISPVCRWAVRRRRTCRTLSRPFRPHYRLRFALPIDAAVGPAMGRAHRGGAKEGIEALVEPTYPRWFPPEIWRRCRRTSTKSAP